MNQRNTQRKAVMALILLGFAGFAGLSLAPAAAADYCGYTDPNHYHCDSGDGWSYYECHRTWWGWGGWECRWRDPRA